MVTLTLFSPRSLRVQIPSTVPYLCSHRLWVGCLIFSQTKRVRVSLGVPLKRGFMFNYDFSHSFLKKYGIDISYSNYLDNGTKMVVVGLSGGVDSSVSALLLKLLGYKVVGIYMKNWTTCNPNDYDDVVSIANKIDIPYYSMSLEDDYRNKVFNSFVDDLNNGLTPNPDVLCNKYIKFDVFFKYALLMGADFIATGHYAKIIDGKLSVPLDKTKDQTYFLHDIDNSCLNKVMFPLSDLTKKIVRMIATDFGLITAKKKDSTGICFIDNGNFRGFISDYISNSKGHFVDLDGNILGSHIGLPFYTIGQKRGLNISFKTGSPLAHKYAQVSLVVYKKNITDNTIVVVPSDSPFLMVDSLVVRSSNFSGICFVRSSNLGELVKAQIIGNKVFFDKPHKIVAAGQYLVYYDDNGIVLGGGIVV